MITESSARPDSPMPAYQFYQGKQSRWINSVIQYMEAREFPAEDIYFLSFYEQRIIPYNKVIEPYPKQKFHPRATEAATFAKGIREFISTRGGDIFVEIHAGRTIADPLQHEMEEHQVPYRIYGSGVPLGTKPNYYESLIDEELKERKVKETLTVKRDIISDLKELSPTEASELVNKYSVNAHVYGIEQNVEELKVLLGTHRQKRKDADKALQAFEASLQEEDHDGELRSFVEGIDLSRLYKDTQLSEMKQRFGKTISKLIYYLIKVNYVQLAENKLREALFRTQIALMK
ncbi:hypothetical protein [Paenibacillus illinoisensis]|uniref:hypothetical protein n=2 Tax=Paenibacillus illinoisensis TaxID=59845 RepID=UPI00301D9540